MATILQLDGPNAKPPRRRHVDHDVKIVGPVLRPDITPAERRLILEQLARMMVPRIMERYRQEAGESAP